MFGFNRIALGQLGAGASTPAPSFDPDYQAILDRATSLGYTLPSSQVKIAGNNLVETLKSDGIWSELDVLYVPATDGDSSFATLNWKSPANFQLTLNNSPSFTPRRGFGGDGISSNISTNFNFQTQIATSKYQQDNAHRAAFLMRASYNSSSNAIDGMTTASVNRMTNSSNVVQRINSSGNVTGAVLMLGGGFKAISRTSSTNILVINDSKVESKATAASIAPPNAAQFLLRSGSAHGDSIIGFYSMGSNIDSTYLQLNTAIKNYMTSLAVTFESEYQAILSYAISQGYALPSAFSQLMQNQCVKDLKDAGFWSKMDILYHFYNDASTIDFALINWKNPGSHTCTPYNSSWIQSSGILLNTNGWMDTNWNPTVHGVKYTLNNANVTAKTAGLNQNIVGTAGGSLTQIRGLSTTSQFINSSNLPATAGGVGGGAYRGISRYNSTDILMHGLSTAQGFFNTVTTQTSTGMPDENITLGRQITNYGNGTTFEHFFAGESFTDSQWVECQRILTTAGYY